jgi:oxygen-independent coproporphyrinogen-3 oxidase
MARCPDRTQSAGSADTPGRELEFQGLSGLYIHIPFCRQACSYCDFYFVTDEARMEAFTDAIRAEIASVPRTRFDTVYFGGGTPSRLDVRQLESILGAVRRHHDAGSVTETTVEANPDDITAERLRAYRDMGVTRLSMGVQTFDEARLRFMNRAHDTRQAHACLDLLAKADFATYTVDLIYGNPGQTVEDLDRDLDALLAYAPPHVSAYALTIEPGTRLGKQHQLKRLTPAEDAEVAAQMSHVAARLADAGLERYEVSNFAKPGHEAVHNRAYWHHVPYVGVGPAAHTFDGAARWSNVRDLAAYVASGGLGARTEREELTQGQLAEERLLMGLRTREGVGRGELSRRYGFGFGAPAEAVAGECVRNGWMTDDGDVIALTETGYAIADAIVLRLLTA